MSNMNRRLFLDAAAASVATLPVVAIVLAGDVAVVAFVVVVVVALAVA